MSSEFSDSDDEQLRKILMDFHVSLEEFQFAVEGNRNKFDAWMEAVKKGKLPPGICPRHARQHIRMGYLRTTSDSDSEYEKFASKGSRLPRTAGGSSGAKAVVPARFRNRRRKGNRGLAHFPENSGNPGPSGLHARHRDASIRISSSNSEDSLGNNSAAMADECIWMNQVWKKNYKNKMKHTQNWIRSQNEEMRKK